MDKPSVHFSTLLFRCRGTALFLLMIFISSLISPTSLAQQPTAKIIAWTGRVLVSGQSVTIGMLLHVGDTIQTQSGALVIVELSDGSTLHIGENTQIAIADLAQTATGARVSHLKLLWGRIRAKLSPGHQQAGSTFDIKTPNALIGVKFSQPDVEVSYSSDTQETIGIAHTVELIAINLVTDEKITVPVGTTVIIVGTLMKIAAGTAASTIAAHATTTTAAETSTTTAGMTTSGTTTGATAGSNTGTIAAVGASIAAAGGIAAVVANSGDGSDSGGNPSTDSTQDLSGVWYFSGSCVAQGCTEDIPCAPSPPDPRPYCCGIRMCDCCEPSWYGQVTQASNTLSGELFIPAVEITYFLSGSVDGNSVSVTIDPDVIIPVRGGTSYTGIIDGDSIHGNFSGFGSTPTTNGLWIPITWSGTFTVNIQKK